MNQYQKNINNSIIYHTDNFRRVFLYDYYNFILSQLIKFCETHNINKSMSLGIPVDDVDVRIGIHTEHNVLTYINETFCELNNLNRSESVDKIITHTITNIEVVKDKDSKKQDYLNKCLYIPPIIHENIIVDNSNRINNVCTLHHSTERRDHMLRNINTHQITNIYKKDDIKKEYDKFKILLNIHQDDFHRSLEELRILPALVTGILVVSEDVPYKDKVPYNKHIIWTSAATLEQTLNDVINNYENYREVYLKDLDKTIEILYALITSEFQKL